MDNKPTKYFPELEGIRGYAFLLVFLTHYFVTQIVSNANPWTYPLRVVADVTWVGVSIFFVLSGYLITGILMRSVGKNGYFRVFYGRRALRVLPLYYLCLAVIFGYGYLQHVNLKGMWTYLIYIQNLGVVSGSGRMLDFHWYKVSISHLWSLAVEEQFYLVWPIVIFFVRGRRGMTIVCFAGILIACLCRYFAPQLGLSTLDSYYATQTRFDALLLGALIALYRSHPAYAYALRSARWIALISFAALLAARVLTGTTVPMGLDQSVNDQWRVVWMIPLGNIFAFAMIIEVMRERCLLNRVCSAPFICRLGMLTYGAYVAHFPMNWFMLYRVTPMLERHMAHRPAVIAVAVGSFVITMVFAALSFRYLEMPFMRMKSKLEYGPPAKPMPISKSIENLSSVLEGILASVSESLRTFARHLEPGPKESLALAQIDSQKTD